MNFPKFNSAEDEERYLHKLHAEGWKVNYKRNDLEQKSFNQLYSRCKKRRARKRMSPLFGEARCRVLDFVEGDSKVVPSAQIVPILQCPEILHPIELEIVEDDTEEIEIEIPVDVPIYPEPSKRRGVIIEKPVSKLVPGPTCLPKNLSPKTQLKPIIPKANDEVAKEFRKIMVARSASIKSEKESRVEKAKEILDLRDFSRKITELPSLD